jgi:NADH:ubiquinone oxidoreductase subunit E
VENLYREKEEEKRTSIYEKAENKRRKKAIITILKLVDWQFQLKLI